MPATSSAKKAVGIVSYGGGASGARAAEHLRLVMAECMVATVRAQALLSLVHDFEQWTKFKPLPHREGDITTLPDAHDPPFLSCCGVGSEMLRLIRG
jgi:NAD(P)H-dependent FMN reductase